MRDILFKAKRIGDGEWVEGYYCHSSIIDKEKSELYNICLKHCIITRNGYCYEIDKYTICQYTGLTDKNGNKIWENDVVKFIEYKGNIVFECGSFGIAFKNTIDWDVIQRMILPVTGCDNRLWACVNDNYISLWEIMWNFNDEEDSVYTVEVIGNIFDNPELLEGGAL